VSERTLVLIKPDGVDRGLVGEITGRFERAGLKILALKMMLVPRELAEKHYSVHRGKPFYEALVEFISSGPVVALVLEGENAIARVRRLMGATDPTQAAPGTIRRDLATSVTHNLVHGSDSPETARQEIANFFGEAELLEYERDPGRWERAAGTE